MRLLSAPVWAIAAGCLLFTASGAVAETRFAPVEGSQVAYEACGDGPKTVVLIHDGILDSSAWDGVWPRLCDAFTVVRYDRRGYGASPAATAPYDPVADLAAVLQAAGVANATLVGSSAGGGVAVEYALAHPDAVKGLVLVGPAVSGFRPTDHFMRRTANLVGLLSRGRLEEAARDPYILTPSAEAARAFVVADLGAHPGNFGAGRMMRSGEGVLGRLKDLSAPTLIVTGEIDMPDVHAHAGALEALIPGARRLVMPGGGHFIYLERPDAFVSVLEDFLAAP
ncbi:alpha/beta fold hydrolase [Brevundimonas goettingensis]|uniref:Alpha/beta hydrolase n=1 Tax=Brevundimonas goettingensis TaxID=2774190 RepID=A0A975GVE4_9CAUL|nr:alpha/beta hydrolase [Brevundimonas goettingensis]QTC91317.1 alpha/beta hydrolase [Brevundimonas goettingensis]